MSFWKMVVPTPPLGKTTLVNKTTSVNKKFAESSMKNPAKISETEWKVMHVLWKGKRLSSNDVVAEWCSNVHA